MLPQRHRPRIRGASAAVVHGEMCGSDGAGRGLIPYTARQQKLHDGSR